MVPNAFPDFTKLFAGAAKLEWHTLIGAQQRNLEALAKAGRIVAEGVQTAFERQADSAGATLKAGFEVAASTMTTPDLGLALERQVAFAQEVAGKTAALSRELVEIAARNGQAAFEVLRERAAQGTEELKSLATPG